MKDKDVSLRHYLDVELGIPEQGEPPRAPLRSYELTWMKLKREYPEDCEELEKDHGRGKFPSD